MTERELAGAVRDLAKLFGWLRYHTWTSVHSPAGFPDEILLRGSRLVVAELKSARSIDAAAGALARGLPDRSLRRGSRLAA
jgi:hypothetical protein